MKITDIKAYPLWYGARNICLVKVETDEGIYGWGESGISSRELAVVGAVSHFREFLVGQDASGIGHIWQELYRGQYFEGGRVLAAAISAIDIALWDIAGKALGVPVHRLIGGAQRDRVPCFATTSSAFDESLVEEAKSLASRGFRVIRIMTDQRGTTESATGIDMRQSMANAAWVLKEVRQELGNSVTLGMDYHHRLTVAEASSFCHMLPSGTLDFLEEPIRPQTPAAYEALRRMVDVPFAIGEECTSKWDFMPFIERGITDFARIDICNVGGITEALKVAAMAEAHYIDIMPHDPLGPVCTAATVQFSAAVQNFAWCEIPPYGAARDGDDGLFTNAPVEVDGFYPLGDAPGHGVDVNEQAIAEGSFKFWEAPRMKKPDGSFTNW